MHALLAAFGEAFDEPETYQGAVPSEAYLTGLLGQRQFIAVAALAGDRRGAPASGLPASTLIQVCRFLSRENRPQYRRVVLPPRTRLPPCLPAFLLALLACAGGGCEATTMTGGHVPVPILLGPVACIGCAPSPPPPTNTPIADETHYEYLLGSGPTGTAWSKETRRTMLGQKAFEAAGNKCRGELRVTRLAASAFDIFAFALAFYKVAIEVEAVATAVPQETCLGSSAPGDSDKGKPE